MPEPAGIDKYPISTVIIANLLPLFIYLIGLFLLYQLGLIPAVIFALFILALEFRVISGHCIDCNYYGKTCAFGKGKISALFFSRGSPDRFCQGAMSWKDMLPDFLVLLIPVLAGMYILISGFTWLILGLLIAIVLLGFCGNGFVRGHLACRFCRQRELGCPAEQLFSKKE
ncbi:MAG: hypothetical protein GYA23_04520 [Methanomicrobiales archaeon]|nr:hypothetical protein [Methanomicrobiales archaeon]